MLDVEKTIFSEMVTLTNVHIWRVGVTPNIFENQPTDIPGEVPAALGMPPEICAEIAWGASGSYPYYKRYRTHWNGATIEGLDWATAAFDILETAATAFAGMSSLIITKTGETLGTPQADSNVKFEQMSKAWYNRTPPGS